MNLSLHQKALNTVRDYKKSEAALIQVLEEIDSDKTYLAFGKSSLFRYCVECLNLSESDSFRFIQVTRKGKTLPLYKAVVTSGALTLAEASRIAPVITPQTQQHWIDKAQALTCRELEREVMALKLSAECATVNSSALPARPVERLKVLTQDRAEIKFTISKSIEDKWRRAQEVFRTASFEATFDKVLDVALKYQDPIEKAKRAKSTAASETELPPALGAKLDPKRAPSTWKANGSIASRENNRRVPTSVKHAVYLRDQGRCTFKGCGERKWVDMHHLKQLSQGGLHRVDNLTTLCGPHHRLLHR